MNPFSVNNKEYLISIHPKYFIFIIVIFISFIIGLSSIFFIKTYDTYSLKALYSCDEDCHLLITITPEISNKFSNISYIKLNNKNIIPESASISDIQLDSEMKSNYQIVDYKVARQDGLENTYQDVAIFYNYEEIVKKIAKFILK